MFKFLRRIRYKLMEQNKIGKYFKYAIGEIILVVIGILIAFQLNNWNEKRKEDAELKEYLFKISQNVTQDIEQIGSLKIRRDTVRAQAIRSSVALMERDFSNLKELIKGQSVFQEFYFIPNKSGFEALKNSPFLGKINNTKVDSLLTHYYSLVDKTYQNEFSYNNFVENMEAQLSTQVDMIPKEIVLIKSYNGEQISAQEYQDLLPFVQNNAFKMAVFRTMEDQTYLRNYKNLVETGKALTSEISRFGEELN